MARKAGTQTVCGVEIPPDQRTPLVDALLGVIGQLQTANEQLQASNEQLRQRCEQLEEEIQRLKGLPEKPKRQPPQSSPLNDPQGPPSASGRKKPKPPGGKRPGSAKRCKTKQLAVHNEVLLRVDDLPEGTKFLGYQDYTVQDLRVEPYNTRYRRGRYRLPDGSFVTAPLPPGVHSHFGPTLQQYVLYQHFHNQVTQPLLHEELRELDIDISAGQVNRLLTENHERFHQEKDALLPAALEVSSYIQADDTSARHRGKSGHTLHIGNDFFASFFTTDSKSRVNFLRILLGPQAHYLWNLDALTYLKSYKVPQKLQEQLQSETGWVWEDDASWKEQLDDWGITSTEQRRLATEAALWASLMQREEYENLVLISDDAAQFKVMGLFHALCWIHAERHVAGLIPLTPAQRRAHEATRDAIWKYYQRLKAYRESPTPQRRGRLERDFDKLFLQKTGWPELNAALEKIHEKKSELLIVLEHPEIPLHNNLSENDIRQYVKKRKISAGTRSDAGRRSRDTFLSLKTSCRKLGVTFWQYLQDRITNLGHIPLLPDLIRQKAIPDEA